jgi:hypothetical protein
MGVVVAQVKKIVSFGDSFIFGSQLRNNDHGDKAWPGLIAKDLGCDYKTFAYPGCGNEAIARQIFEYFAHNSADHTLAVINWTWCSRWDFYSLDNKQWFTLGPTCVPKKLDLLFAETEAQQLIDFYSLYMADAHLWNQLRSLQAIVAVQSFLQSKGIKHVQTFMDRELLMPAMNRSRLEHYKAYKDPSWPNIDNESQINTLPDHIKNEIDLDYLSVTDPGYIQMLQKMCLPHMQTFQGLTFLEWCHQHGFPVTPSPFDHPLEQAHEAARQLWKSEYEIRLA